MLLSGASFHACGGRPPAREHHATCSRQPVKLWTLQAADVPQAAASLQRRQNARGCGPARVAAATERPPAEANTQEELPLILRALKGEKVHRPPVWMMRQAGRYMKTYQELCKKHPSFRERSEVPDLAVEVSLQPWEAFRPDGVILFSDILTPLEGMNIPFDIAGGEGPIIHSPIRTIEAVKQVTSLVPQESTPFVGEALTRLREEVGNQATVLGFVGAPFTLASYIIEGGSSKNYTHIKRLAFSDPETLHALLSKLADNIATYVQYQADTGAQVVQIFDSWASELTPQDFDVFSAPYIRQIIDTVRKSHPDLAIILYISGSGGLLERMAIPKPDVISVDQRVDMQDAIRRIGPDFAVQGNMDPGVLFGSRQAVEQRVIDTVKSAQGTRHIMNLGHGVLVGTPEDNVAHFFEVAKSVHERL